MSPLQKLGLRPLVTIVPVVPSKGQKSFEMLCCWLVRVIELSSPPSFPWRSFNSPTAIFPHGTTNKKRDETFLYAVNKSRRQECGTGEGREKGGGGKRHLPPAIVVGSTYVLWNFDLVKFNLVMNFDLVKISLLTNLLALA